MNKYIRFICILLAFAVGFTSCDDEDNNTQTEILTAAFATSVLKTMENVTPLMVPVVLNRPAVSDVQVTAAVKSEEGAKEGEHYRFQSKVITIPQGTTIGYFNVDIMDDREINPDRSFVAEIVSVKGAAILAEGEICKVVIQSDEGYPVLEFQETQLTALEENPHFEVPVVLSKPYAEDVTFKIQVKDGGTALPGEHFLLDTDKDYVIPAGDTLVNIGLTIIDDDLVNDDRAMELRIIEATNAEISQIFQETKITIVNDDRDAYVSFVRTTAEGFESDDFIWIPVKVEGIYKRPITVTLSTEDETAIEGTDYHLENNTLYFDEGKMADSVKLFFHDNDEINKDKTFKIYLSQIENALKADKDTIMSVTIINDDINKVHLYDDLMGSWTITQSRNDVAKSATMEIYAGDTPEEEDNNYQKILVCKVPKYREGKDVMWKMSFDPATGEMKVITGEMAMKETVSFAAPLGVSNIILLPGTSGHYGFDPNPVSITSNKNFTELIVDPQVVLYGMIKTVATGKVNSNHYFALENVVMKKNK